MTTLGDHLAARIDVHGPIPFSEFMEAALYEPGLGYYARGGGRTGFEGDYVTSPELDAAFGELWGHAFEQIWAGAGEPEHFVVVEVGPGEAGFTSAFLQSLSGRFASVVEVVLVERIAALELRQQRRLRGLDHPITWVRSIEECPTVETGVVFANEVLDNAPVDVIKVDDGVTLALFVTVRDGRLAPTWLPADPILRSYAEAFVSPTEGRSREVSIAAADLVSRCASVFERGALVFVDYGATVPSVSSLLTYSAAGVDDDLLARPGEKDITAFVDWAAVTKACESAGLNPAPPLKQREVLRRLGASKIDHRLQKEHRAARESGDGAGMVRTLSRRQALGALLDPSGLGGFDVLVATRGLGVPPFAASDGE